MLLGKGQHGEGGMLTPQEAKNKPSKTPTEVGGKLSLLSASAGFLLGSIFDPEEGSDMIF